MNNRANAIKNIQEFIDSETEKVILLKGTHQFKKHSLVLKMISKSSNLNTGLYRTNSMQNITMQLEQTGLKIRPSQKFSSGKRYRINGADFYFDTLLTKRTWNNTPTNLDFALVYPVDSFCGKSEEDKRGLMADLLNHKSIQKVFIVTWTDNAGDYDWIRPYVDKVITYDAKEEDPDYHERVLKIEK